MYKNIMNTIVETFIKPLLKQSIPDIQPGDTVRVHQRIVEGEKERIQVFEGVVIALKHGKGIQGTFTVRKISSGVGVERIFPLHSPLVENIEIVKRAKVRRAKLYYLRNLRGKKARLKARAFDLEAPEEEPAENIEEPNDSEEEKPKEQEEQKEEQKQETSSDSEEEKSKEQEGQKEEESVEEYPVEEEEKKRLV